LAKLEEYHGELVAHKKDDDVRFRIGDDAQTQRLNEMDKKIGLIQGITMDTSITVARIEGGLEAKGILQPRSDKKVS